MKKQSAALRDDGETKKTGGPMKRPAATGSLNKTLEDMRGGIKKAKTDDDENQKNAENENESEESDHRDKGKAIKFRQMQKDLPPHILDLYEREAMSKSSPRAFRTNIINQLFTKLPTGRYSLNVDKPMFKEAKEMFDMAPRRRRGTLERS